VRGDACGRSATGASISNGGQRVARQRRALASEASCASPLHAHVRPPPQASQKVPAFRLRLNSWPSLLAPTISVTTPIARRVSK
jgi:hypothetical protein